MSYIADYRTRMRVMGAEYAAQRNAAEQRSLEERLTQIEARVAQLEAAKQEQSTNG